MYHLQGWWEDLNRDVQDAIDEAVEKGQQDQKQDDADQPIDLNPAGGDVPGGNYVAPDSKQGSMGSAGIMFIAGAAIFLLGLMKKKK